LEPHWQQRETSPAIQPIKIFARPFELEIHRAPEHDSALPAKVRRVLAAGPRVKVELTVGEDVFVYLRDAKVFLENST